MSDLDKVLATHKDGINSGQIIALESLLYAIKIESLTEIYQVEGLINNKLDELKAHEYEVDARADNASSEQFPNV